MRQAWLNAEDGHRLVFALHFNRIQFGVLELVGNMRVSEFTDDDVDAVVFGNTFKA